VREQLASPRAADEERDQADSAPGASDSLAFEPSHLQLKRNRTYRLLLTNPTDVYHNWVATVRPACTFPGAALTEGTRSSCCTARGGC